MPASHLQPMTEVAKPVKALAEAIAHFSLCAVMMTLAAHILKASAKVSTTSVDSMCMLLESWMDRYATTGNGVV